jgi:hypothetical protein
MENISSGWVGPRSGLNEVVKRKKKYLPLPGKVPWWSSPYPVSTVAISSTYGFVYEITLYI